MLKSEIDPLPLSLSPGSEDRIALDSFWEKVGIIGRRGSGR
jgi:hypothetical protein